MSWSLRIHEQIAEAISSGELKQPESLMGKPLDLRAYFATPPHLRMGYSILAGSGHTPLEVDILKQMNRLEEEMAAEIEESRLKILRMEFDQLAIRFEAETRSHRS